MRGLAYTCNLSRSARASGWRNPAREEAPTATGSPPRYVGARCAASFALFEVDVVDYLLNALHRLRKFSSAILLLGVLHLPGQRYDSLLYIHLKRTALYHLIAGELDHHIVVDHVVGEYLVRRETDADS